MSPKELLPNDPISESTHAPCTVKVPVSLSTPSPDFTHKTDMVLFVDENELPFACNQDREKETDDSVVIDDSPSGFLRERLKSIKGRPHHASARQLKAPASYGPPRRNATFSSIPAKKDVHDLPAVFYKTSGDSGRLAVKRRRDLFQRLRNLLRRGPS